MARSEAHTACAFSRVTITLSPVAALTSAIGRDEPSSRKLAVPAGIVGRANQLAWLVDAVEAARQVRAATRVLFGDPGIGKTALLDAVIEAAPEFQTVRVSGIESEMELGYSALHRLLLPFGDHVERLPAPQRTALKSAFGEVDVGAPDRFVIGLATLSVLGNVATHAPLLCVVDDAQWLDRESLAALAVAARRLHADAVAMLFATREDPTTLESIAGFDQLLIGGLEGREAAELIRRVVSDAIPERVIDRIVTDTAGNPLAIIELAHSLSSDDLTDRGLRPEPLPIGRKLEQHFLQQVRGLPEATQQFLLLAAAEPSDDPGTVLRAAAQIGLGADAADPAADERLFRLDSRPLFRHPLIRSAVYNGSSAADRRKTHAALASVTDAPGDTDRRAWHRAAAAVGPDAAVARELEHEAERAQARGGYSAAGVYLARAAELTPDTGQRADRLLAAARSHLTGGALSRARALLDAADFPFSDSLRRAEVVRLDGGIAAASGNDREAVVHFLRASTVLAPLDIRRARGTLRHAAEVGRLAAMYSPSHGSPTDIASAVRHLPLATDRPSAADLLLDGYAMLHLDGLAAAVPLIRRALAVLAADDAEASVPFQWLGMGCWAASSIADSEALESLATRLVHAARAQGALIQLSIGLGYLAMSHEIKGLLPEARTSFVERAQLMAAFGVSPDVGYMVVSAWEGREEATRVAMDEVLRSAEAREHGWMFGFVEYARGVLELGLGNYEAAGCGGTKAYDDDWVLAAVGYPNMIEALVRCDRLDDAAIAAATYAEKAKAMGTPMSLGLLARTAALLADDSIAEGLHLEAIKRLSAARADLHVARAHLLFGEWLRRQQRRIDARAQLRAAYEIFARTGADAFAERARVELAATGERARRRSPDTARDLTSQESQIAHLASLRHTNAEIAAKLFLSVSTVDYHLRKVYRKLSINSRRHLAPALAGYDTVPEHAAVTLNTVTAAVRVS
jgi:DNA-binding CsgD family transcriptional regulator